MDEELIKQAKRIDPEVWKEHAKVLSEIHDQIIESLGKVGSILKYGKEILTRQEREIMLNPELDKQVVIEKLAEIGDKAEVIRQFAAEIVFTAGGQKLEAGFEVSA